MNGIPHFVIVGSNSRNQELLAQFIRNLGYEVIRADSLAELDRLLAENRPLGFALVDITGFDQRIWERCTSLNSLNTPLLIISPRQSAEVTRIGFAHGAQSVLSKPLVMQELAGILHGFIQARRN